MAAISFQDISKAEQDRARDNVKSVLTTGKVAEDSKTGTIAGDIVGTVWDMVTSPLDVIGEKIVDTGDKVSQAKIFQQNKSDNWLQSNAKQVGGWLASTGIKAIGRALEAPQDIMAHSMIGWEKSGILDNYSGINENESTTKDKSWGEISGNIIGSGLDMWAGGLSPKQLLSVGGIKRGLSNSYKNITNSIVAKNATKNLLKRGAQLGKSAIQGTSNTSLGQATIRAGGLGIASMIEEPIRNLIGPAIDIDAKKQSLRSLGWSVDRDISVGTIEEIGKEYGWGNNITDLNSFNSVMEANGIEPFESKNDAQAFLQETYKGVNNESYITGLTRSLSESIQSGQIVSEGPEKFFNDDGSEKLVDEINTYSKNNIKEDFITNFAKTGKEKFSSYYKQITSDEEYQPVRAINHATNSFVRITEEYTIGRIGANNQELLEYIDNPKVQKYFEQAETAYNANLAYATTYALKSEKISSENEDMSWKDVHRQASRESIMDITGAKNYREALDIYRNAVQINGASIESQGSRILADVRGAGSYDPNNWFDVIMNRTGVGVSQINSLLEEHVYRSDARAVGNLTELIDIPGEGGGSRLLNTLEDRGFSTVTTIFGLVASKILTKRISSNMPQSSMTRAVFTEGLEEVFEEAAVVANTNADGEYFAAGAIGSSIGALAASNSLRAKAGAASMNPNIVGKSGTDWVNQAMGYDSNEFTNSVLKEVASVRFAELSQKKELTKKEQSELSFLEGENTPESLRVFYKNELGEIEKAIKEYTKIADEIANDINSQSVAKPDQETEYIKNDIADTVAQASVIMAAIKKDPNNQRLNRYSEWLNEIYKKQIAYYKKTENTQRDLNDYLIETRGRSFTSVRDYDVFRSRSKEGTAIGLVGVSVSNIKRSNVDGSFNSFFENNKEKITDIIGSPWMDKTRSKGNKEGYYIITESIMNERVGKSKYNEVDRRMINLSGRDIEVIEYTSGKDRKLRAIKDTESNSYVIGKWVSAASSFRDPYEVADGETFQSKIIDSFMEKYYRENSGRQYSNYGNGDISIDQNILEEKDEDGISEVDATIIQAKIAQEAKKKTNIALVEKVRNEVEILLEDQYVDGKVTHTVKNINLFFESMIEVLSYIGNRTEKKVKQAADLIKGLVIELIEGINKKLKSSASKLIDKMIKVSSRYNKLERANEEIVNNYIDGLLGFSGMKERTIMAATKAMIWMWDKGVYLGYGEEDIINISKIAEELNERVINDVEEATAEIVVAHKNDGTDDNEGVIIPMETFNRMNRKVNSIINKVNNVKYINTQRMYRSIVDTLGRLHNATDDEMDKMNKIIVQGLDEMNDDLHMIDIFSHLTEDYGKMLDVLGGKQYSLFNETIDISGDSVSLLSLLRSSDPLPFVKARLMNPKVAAEKLLDNYDNEITKLQIELLYSFIAGDSTGIRNYFYILSSIGDHYVEQNKESKTLLNLIDSYVKNSYRTYKTKKVLSMWTKGQVDDGAIEIEINGKNIITGKKQAVITVGKAKSGKSTWAKKMAEKDKGYKVLSINDMGKNIGGQEAMKRLMKAIDTVYDDKVIIDISNTKKSQRRQVVGALRKKGYDVSAVLFNTVGPISMVDETVKEKRDFTLVGPTAINAGAEVRGGEIIMESERREIAISQGIDEEYLEAEVMPTVGDLLAEGIQIVDRELNYINMNVFYNMDKLSVVSDNGNKIAYNVNTKVVNGAIVEDGITINLANFNPNTDIKDYPVLAAALLIRLNPSLLYNEPEKQVITNKIDGNNMVQWSIDPWAVIFNAKQLGVIPENTETISDILSDINIKLLSLPKITSSTFTSHLAAERISNIIGLPVTDDIFVKGKERLTEAMVRLNESKNRILGNSPVLTSTMDGKEYIVSNKYDADEEIIGYNQTRRKIINLSKVLLDIGENDVLSIISDERRFNGEFGLIFAAITKEGNLVNDYIEVDKKQFILVRKERTIGSPSFGSAQFGVQSAKIVISIGENKYKDIATNEIINGFNPETDQVHYETKKTPLDINGEEMPKYSFRFNNKKTKIGIGSDGNPVFRNMPNTRKISATAQINEVVKEMQRSNIISNKNDKRTYEEARKIVSKNEQYTKQGTYIKMRGPAAGKVTGHILGVIEKAKESEAEAKKLFIAMNESRMTLGLRVLGSFDVFNKLLKNNTISDLEMRSAILAQDAGQVETALLRIQEKMGFNTSYEGHDISIDSLVRKIIEFMSMMGWNNETGSAELWARELAELIHENTGLGIQLRNLYLYGTKESELELQNFLNTGISSSSPLLSTLITTKDKTKEKTVGELIGLLFNDLDMAEEALDAMSVPLNDGSVFLRANQNFILDKQEFNEGTSFVNFTKSREIKILMALYNTINNQTRSLGGLKKGENVGMSNAMKILFDIDKPEKKRKEKTSWGEVIDFTIKQAKLIDKVFEGNEKKYKIYEITRFINGVIGKINNRFVPLRTGTSIIDSRGNFRKGREKEIAKIISGALLNGERKYKSNPILIHNRLVGNNNTSVEVIRYDDANGTNPTGNIFFTKEELLVLDKDFMRAWSGANDDGMERGYGNELISGTEVTETKQIRRMLLADEISRIDGLINSGTVFFSEKEKLMNIRSSLGEKYDSLFSANEESEKYKVYNSQVKGGIDIRDGAIRGNIKGGENKGFSEGVGSENNNTRGVSVATIVKNKIEIRLFELRDELKKGWEKLQKTEDKEEEKKILEKLKVISEKIKTEERKQKFIAEKQEEKYMKEKYYIDVSNDIRFSSETKADQAQLSAVSENEENIEIGSRLAENSSQEAGSQLEFSADEGESILMKRGFASIEARGGEAPIIKTINKSMTAEEFTYYIVGKTSRSGEAIGEGGENVDILFKLDQETDRRYKGIDFDTESDLDYWKQSFYKNSNNLGPISSMDNLDAASKKKREELKNEIEEGKYNTTRITSSYIDFTIRTAANITKSEIDMLMSIKNGNKSAERKMLDRLNNGNKKTLKSWINYLDSNETYDASFKRMIVNDLVKRHYVEGKGVVKRTNSTIIDYPSVNQGSIAVLYESRPNSVTEGLRKSSGSYDVEDFSGYVYRETQEGAWYKFEKGTDGADLSKFVNKGTCTWCTKGYKTATAQLRNGDFYVYYSNTSNQPELAILTKESHIGEIRGSVPNSQAIRDDYLDEMESFGESEFGEDDREFSKEKIENSRKLKNMRLNYMDGKKPTIGEVWNIRKENKKYNYEFDGRIGVMIDDLDVIATLKKDSDIDAKMYLAQKTDTPKEALIKLANDDNEEVKVKVARNKNTPKEILIKLADDYDNDRVRVGVAQNENTPKETLIKLANDDNEEVKAGVAQNENTPKETLIKLADDLDPQVIGVLKKRLNKVDIDFQKQGGVVSGAFVVSENSIYLTKDADYTTSMHKLAHAYEKVLTDEERKVVLEWSGDAEWTQRTSEKFAKGFEKHVYEKSVSGRLGSIFNKFANEFVKLIKAAINYFSDINDINNDMRKIYEEIIGERNNRTLARNHYSFVRGEFVRRKEDIINNMLKKEEQLSGKEKKDVTSFEEDGITLRKEKNSIDRSDIESWMDNVLNKNVMPYVKSINDNSVTFDTEGIKEEIISLKMDAYIKKTETKDLLGGITKSLEETELRGEEDEGIRKMVMENTKIKNEHAREKEIAESKLMSRLEKEEIIWTLKRRKDRIISQSRINDNVIDPTRVLNILDKIEDYSLKRQTTFMDAMKYLATNNNGEFIEKIKKAAEESGDPIVNAVINNKEFAAFVGIIGETLKDDEIDFEKAWNTFKLITIEERLLSAIEGEAYDAYYAAEKENEKLAIDSEDVFNEYDMGSTEIINDLYNDC